MKPFVASRVCWTIWTRSRSSPFACVGIAIEQPLHDLGLERDVRERLRRPVVHRPRDLAAQVLLGVEDHARQRRGQRLGDLGQVRAGGSRDPRPVAGVDDRDVDAADLVHDRGDRVPVARERPALAVEDVDLRLHERRPAGEQQRLGVGLGRVLRLGQLLGGLNALLLVAGRLGPCLTDEHVDLGQLAVEGGDIGRKACAERLPCGRLRVRVLGHRAVVSPGSVADLSPPASGSSPGASRTPRPGSGR